MKNKFVRLGKTVAILLITVFMLPQCQTKTPNNGNLEMDFMNPATETRPLAFWTWLNGFVDTSRMVFEIEEMKDKGMQGAFIWDVGAWK